MDTSTLIGLGIAVVLALYNRSKKPKEETTEHTNENEHPEVENKPKSKNPFDFLKEIQQQIEAQELENQRKAIEEKTRQAQQRTIHNKPKPSPKVKDIEQEELEKTIERNSSSSYAEKHSIMQIERNKADKIRLDEEEKNVYVSPYLEMFSDVSELKKAFIYKEILDRKEY